MFQQIGLPVQVTMMVTMVIMFMEMAIICSVVPDYHCIVVAYCALRWQETAEFNQSLLPHTTQGQSVQEYRSVDSKKIQNVDFISQELLL